MFVLTFLQELPTSSFNQIQSLSSFNWIKILSNKIGGLQLYLIKDKINILKLDSLIPIGFISNISFNL